MKSKSKQDLKTETDSTLRCADVTSLYPNIPILPASKLSPASFKYEVFLPTHILTVWWLYLTGYGGPVYVIMDMRWRGGCYWVVGSFRYRVGMPVLAIWVVHLPPLLDLLLSLYFSLPHAHTHTHTLTISLTLFLSPSLTHSLPNSLSH